MGAATIGIVAVLLLGGGTSVAAQNALPGDTLYPVKTNINEEVRGWIAIGDEAEAEYRARLAERRLEELETLSTEGSVSAEARKQIQERFQEHVEDLETRLEQMEEKKLERALEITAQTERNFMAHEKALGQFRERIGDGGEMEQHVFRVGERLRGKEEFLKERAQEAIENMKDDEASQHSAGKIHAADNVIDSAEKSIATHPRATEESQNKARDLLEEARHLLEEARSMQADGTPANAFAVAHEASRTAHEARASLEVEARTGLSDVIQERVRNRMEGTPHVPSRNMERGDDVPSPDTTTQKVEDAKTNKGNTETNAQGNAPFQNNPNQGRQ